MSRYDRLSALMGRFALRIQSAPLDQANLLVVGRGDGGVKRVLFRTHSIGFEMPADVVVMAAVIDWGGKSNPLLAALPTEIELDLDKDPETGGLLALLQSELDGQRCGVDSVVNRLCEVLIVRMLRAQVGAGATGPGLLAGLADERLSRAIVAIHDEPGKNWSNGELSRIAGLSLSRFTELFAATVGEPPSSYLRRWRLTLAGQDVAKGHRINAIALRYGYGSADGFARAFKKQFGDHPVALGPRADGRV